MNTTTDLRHALLLGATDGPGLDPAVVLAAGRRHRRRIRTQRAVGSLGVVAAAAGVLGAVSVFGTTDPDAAQVASGDLLSYASAEWEPNDDGSVQLGWRLRAEIDDDGLLCVSSRATGGLNSGCGLADNSGAETSSSWGGNVLAFYVHEPITTGTVTVDGRDFTPTIFSFAEHPQTRIAVTLLPVAMSPDNGPAQFTGLDGSGDVLVEAETR